MLLLNFLCEIAGSLLVVGVVYRDVATLCSKSAGDLGPESSVNLSEVEAALIGKESRSERSGECSRPSRH